MGLKTDMSVRLKDSYTGYFRDLKGRTLTVMQVFAPDKRSDEPEKVTIAEIEEIHLIRSDNFEVVKHETAN